MEAQPPGIGHHKKGDRRSRKTGDHRSLSHKPEVSAPGEPLGSRGREVGTRGGGGSLATSSSHSAENPPASS